MNRKSIIVKETTTYFQSEQVEIRYVLFPQRGFDKVWSQTKNIEQAFLFNTESLLLKFHPIKNNQNTLNVHYGRGVRKTEWLYVDKEPNDDNFSQKRDLKDIQINISFPKFIKDSSNEKIQDN